MLKCFDLRALSKHIKSINVLSILWIFRSSWAFKWSVQAMNGSILLKLDHLANTTLINVTRYQGAVFVHKYLMRLIIPVLRLWSSPMYSNLCHQHSLTLRWAAIWRRSYAIFLACSKRARSTMLISRIWSTRSWCASRMAQAHSSPWLNLHL